MPRKPFNTTCDIYKGPGTATPGLFVGTFNCRYVVEDGIHAIGRGCPPIPAYITLEGYEPQGAWTSPWFGMDPSLCDRIAIPSGDSLRFWVLYTDIVIWHAQASYYRVYVVYLPVPAQGPDGGIVFNGSAIVTFTPLVAGGGGILFNGSALGEMTRMRLFTGSGGILFNGTAAISFTPGITYYWKDTFTDTNGTALSVHMGETTPGGYTVQSLDFQIQGNKCVVNGVAPVAQVTFNPAQATRTTSVDFSIPDTGIDAGNRQFILNYRGGAVMSAYCRVRVLFASGFNSCSSYFVETQASGIIATVSCTLNVNTVYTMTVVTDATKVNVTIGPYTSGNVSNTDQSGNTTQGLAYSGNTVTTSTPAWDNLFVTS
jgi:hypothetical protein